MPNQIRAAQDKPYQTKAKQAKPLEGTLEGTLKRYRPQAVKQLPLNIEFRRFKVTFGGAELL